MKFKALETPQKLRGGYYTPASIAELLSRWVLSCGARTLLEPSCGDGAFLRALASQLATATKAGYAGEITVDAVEIVAEEAAKSELASARLRAAGARVRVVQDDIFRWLQQENAFRQWDAILGNPPYIRYQYFAQEQRELAERLFRQAGVAFSRRTNAWAALALACVMHLKPGGCLALVLPAELLHIQHAGGLRRFLEQEMETITLLHLREMVFPSVLQGVVLVLARKKHADTVSALTTHPDQPDEQRFPLPPLVSLASRSQSASIHLRDLDNLADLSSLSLASLSAQTLSAPGDTIGETGGEWMLGLLTREETELLDRLRAHPAVQPFAAIADVDIGIVTGANRFFVVDRETLERFELVAIASPMLAKSELIKGIIYSQNDHNANQAAGKAVFFLSFPALPLSELSAPMAAYIKSGEAQLLHTRYKCRIREPWYVVPYTWTAELALLKRSHLFPRLIVNELAAHSTDTAYRIRLRPVYVGRGKDLTCSFLNSLTFLCAELGGRHYGGGVLELVPSEIEKLLIPLQTVDEQTFARVDTMIRAHVPLDELLAVTDELILGRGLGLTGQENAILRNAHRRLMRRRLRHP